MPEEGMACGWPKMSWCNWYFQCRQHERKLLLDKEIFDKQFAKILSKLVIDGESPWPKRRRGEL
eukprot:1172889-Heterocapsa_arctica.AAC.1